jgi:hypothetical protein
VLEHSFGPFQRFNNFTVLARCQAEKTYNLRSLPAGCNLPAMDAELLRLARKELARQGGLARAQTLTAKQRRESATKASKAAARARTRKAKERKRVRENEG